MQSWHDAWANDTKIEIGFHLAELCCECEYPHTHTHAHTNPHTRTELFSLSHKTMLGRRGAAAGSFCAPAASRFITLNSRPERPQKVCNMGVQLCLC